MIIVAPVNQNRRRPTYAHILPLKLPTLSHNTPDMLKSSRILRHRGLLTLLIIAVILIADQCLKIWVKTHFYLGESYPIFSWFELVFVQNNGMAFGWEIGSKLLLTLFRIAAVAFISFYILRIYARHEAKTGYLVCLALVVAGAAGNIIDCLCYGLIFNNPLPPEVATLFPESGGYGTLMHGLVVDMLYFPLCEWTWPTWMPWVGGEHFVFFRPVFNIADSAISVGMIALILFYSQQIADVPWRKSSQAKADTTDEA